jgi:hypothetical protein
MSLLTRLVKQIAPHMECIVIGHMKEEDKETLKTLVWEMWGRPKLVSNNVEGLKTKDGRQLYIWEKENEEFGGMEHVPRICVG